MSKFASKRKESGPQTEALYNDYDIAMNEMALTFEEHVKGGTMKAMTKMMEGWVSMESNEFSIETAVSDVKEGLSIEELCGLKNEDNTVEVDDCDEPEEPVTKMPSQEELNEVAIKLKAMSVMIGEMPKEFSKYSQQINDASEGLRSTLRKVQGQRRGNKANNSRQGSLLPFLPKPAM